MEVFTKSDGSNFYLNWFVLMFEFFTSVQLINMARYIEMWVFVRVRVRVCIIQLSRSRITYILEFTIYSPFNNLYSIHNLLLCKNPRNECHLVTKNETLNI